MTSNEDRQIRHAYDAEKLLTKATGIATKIDDTVNNEGKRLLLLSQFDRTATLAALHLSLAGLDLPPQTEGEMPL